mgnify:FL=1
MPMHSMMRIRTVMTRLVALAVVAAVGLAGLTWASARLVRQEKLDAAIAKTRNLAEAARDVAGEFDRRAQQGEFDQATARKLAAGALRAMRYDGVEYFFVYDFDGNTVVLGPRPEREGKNFLDAKDATGLPFIAAMIDLAKQGGGHLFYHFPKPGQSEAERQVSSVTAYGPWRWMVGTGLYLDDVDAAFRAALTRLALIGVGVLVVVMALAWLIARSIAAPLHRLAAVTARLGGGEFEVEVPAVGRADEIGTLAQAIAVLRDEAAAAQRLRDEQERVKAGAEAERHRAMLSLAQRFEGTVQGVMSCVGQTVGANAAAARRMAGTADGASRDAAGVAGAAGQVNASIETVAAASEELSTSIGEISAQVQRSSRIADEAVDKAAHTNDCVKGLASAVSRIGEVVNLINAIAGQTNLLALNATIEAARAGDAGKGFAVVAGEVKGLATQTARATGEIAGQIQAVQSATHDAVNAIGAIAETLGAMAEVSSTIAAAVEEQSAATGEISRNINQAAAGALSVADFIDRLAEVTRQVGEDAARMAQSSETLHAQTTTLQGEATDFLTAIRGGRATAS